MAEGPYSRVYWQIDVEFPQIYEDKLALGWWTTLLVAADRDWPSRPYVPRGIPTDVLDKLTQAELIVVGTDDRYSVRGMDQERERRVEAGRVAGLASGANRTARSTARSTKRPTAGATVSERPLNLDRVRDRDKRMESGTDVPSSIRDTRARGESITDLQRLAEELTQQPYVMANVHTKLGERAQADLQRHGFAAVANAWQQVATTVGGLPTLRQIVLGADDILNPVPDMAGAVADQEEQARKLKREERSRKQMEYLRGLHPASG